MSSPALPKVTGTFSSLVFFYDPLHKTIPFSNMSLELFFGSPVDLENEIPFIALAEEKDARELSKQWEICLQLKEDQSHYFWFQKKLPDGAAVIFHFHAVGLRMENSGSAHGILVSAEKTPAGNVAAWMMESERLRKTLDRYKEEYAEFIDIATHNLDAPLRKLGVLIDRVTGKYANNKDQPTDDYLERIHGCLADMRSLIDSLATLSRITSSSLNPVACNLENLVQEQWQELRQQVFESKALISTSSLPELEGDLMQYRQLFRQLLANAIRFAKKDEPPEIHISARPVTEKEKKTYNLAVEKNYFRIEVRDNGIGFRQEYAEKIFRPFLRLHGKSEYPGNGIGLALSKRIVENHRGAIYAESIENEGARIVLYLPQILN